MTPEQARTTEGECWEPCGGCEAYGGDPIDHWNAGTGHWYCQHGNDACHRHGTDA